MDKQLTTTNICLGHHETEHHSKHISTVSISKCLSNQPIMLR